MILTGAAAALVGLVVGSFVTTAALRATRGEQVITGRSACDHCGAALSYFATAPVISYVVRRGGCGSCQGRIDPLHPIGEVVAAVIAGASFTFLPPAEALLVSAMGLTLLASSVIDARTRRLPNILTLIVAILGLGLTAMRELEAVIIAGVAAALAVVVLSGLRAAAAWSGRDQVLGFGDVKLIGAFALWLGMATPWAIAVAAGLGLVAVAVLRPADRRISFGPALAAAGWTIGLAIEAGLWPA